MLNLFKKNHLQKLTEIESDFDSCDGVIDEVLNMRRNLTNELNNIFNVSKNTKIDDVERNAIATKLAGIENEVDSWGKFLDHILNDREELRALKRDYQQACLLKRILGKDYSNTVKKLEKDYSEWYVKHRIDREKLRDGLEKTEETPPTENLDIKRRIEKWNEKLKGNNMV
jgi:hypothetical protein